MKRILIMAAIGAVLGLSGCGDQATDATTTAGATEANENSQAQARATMNFAVRFPSGGDATAAVIDANTEVIAVAVYRSPAADWPALEVLKDDCSPIATAAELSVLAECSDYRLMSERTSPVATGTMTPTQPTTSMNVPPGSYLIVATQFDSAFSMANGGLGTAESRSLVTLDEGNHSVVMNMLHGTWTMVDEVGAAAPITLQLLNNSTLNTSLGIDWDISTPSIIETAAEAAGITGPIVGSHFLGMGYFIANYGLPDEAPIYDDDDNTCSSFGCDYVPILRIDDGSGGVTDVLLEQKFFYDESDNASALVPEAAALLQSYDPVTANSNVFSAGGFSLRSWGYDAVTGSEIGASAGLFTIIALDDMVLNGPPTDDGSDYIYPSETESDEWVNQRSYRDINWNLVTVHIADVSFWDYQMKHPNSEAPLSTYPVTKVVDSSTIQGTLVEYIGSDDASSDYPVAPIPGYSGAAPDGSTAMGVAIAAALELEAAALGLKAIASSTYGSNCVSITNVDGEISLQYMWDELSSSWIPGSWNNSYRVVVQSSIYVIMGEDLDGDGIVEPFESAFHNPHIEWVGSGVDPVSDMWVPLGDAAKVCEWDSVNPYMETCYIDPTSPGEYEINAPDPADVMSADLDGDGLIEQYESVLTESISTGQFDACLHPFTLSGGQLEVTTSGVDVVISSN